VRGHVKATTWLRHENQTGFKYSGRKAAPLDLAGKIARLREKQRENPEDTDCGECMLDLARSAAR
jgi:hypothetical protein